MSPEEFDAHYPQLIGWIEQTLAAHSKSARKVASIGFTRLPLSFEQELLQATKFVVVGRVPVPPLSAMGLTRFAAFEQGQYGGITYLDTFFVRADLAGDEPLYFHELIHVIQWRMLGPKQFLMSYAAGLERCGYENSPLEQMAYAAQHAFESGKNIDAERYVSDYLPAAIDPNSTRQQQRP